MYRPFLPRPRSPCWSWLVGPQFHEMAAPQLLHCPVEVGICSCQTNVLRQRCRGKFGISCAMTVFGQLGPFFDKPLWIFINGTIITITTATATRPIHVVIAQNPEPDFGFLLVFVTNGQSRCASQSKEIITWDWWWWCRYFSRRRRRWKVDT